MTETATPTRRQRVQRWLTGSLILLSWLFFAVGIAPAHAHPSQSRPLVAQTTVSSSFSNCQTATSPTGDQPQLPAQTTKTSSHGNPLHDPATTALIPLRGYDGPSIVYAVVQRLVAPQSLRIPSRPYPADTLRGPPA